MKLLLMQFLSVFFFSVANENSEPQVIFKNNQIEITSMTEQCHDIQNGMHQEYEFLTIQNLTSDKLEVTYEKELWYNGKCISCSKPSDEYSFKLVLAPNQSLSGSCAKKEKALSVFSKMLNMKKSELSKFEIKNIVIKTIAK